MSAQHVIDQPANDTIRGTVKHIRPGQLFIGGRWREAKGGGRFGVVNPATEEVDTLQVTRSMTL